MRNLVRSLAAVVVGLGFCGYASAWDGCCGWPIGPRQTYDNGWPYSAPIPCLGFPYQSPYHQVNWITPPEETAQDVLTRLAGLGIPLVPPPSQFLGKVSPFPKKETKKEPPKADKKKAPPKKGPKDL